MCGHENGFFLAAQFLDDVVNFAAHLRIETRSRFIEKNNSRIVDEGHGEGQALFLSAGELIVKSIAFILEAEPLEKFLGLAAAFIEAGEKAQSFHNANLVGEGSGLQRGANFMFESCRFALRIETANGDAASIQVAEAFQNLDRGGLSSAVGSEQAEDFAFFHVEADATHGFYIAVAFYEIFNLKNGSWHCRSFSLAGDCKRAYSIPQKCVRPVTCEQAGCSFTSEYACSRRGISRLISWVV